MSDFKKLDISMLPKERFVPDTGLLKQAEMQGLEGSMLDPIGFGLLGGIGAGVEKGLYAGAKRVPSMYYDPNTYKEAYNALTKKYDIVPRSSVKGVPENVKGFIDHKNSFIAYDEIPTLAHELTHLDQAKKLKSSGANILSMRDIISDKFSKDSIERKARSLYLGNQGERQARQVASHIRLREKLKDIKNQTGKEADSLTKEIYRLSADEKEMIGAGIGNKITSGGIEAKRSLMNMLPSHRKLRNQPLSFDNISMMGKLGLVAGAGAATAYNINKDVEELKRKQK